ncbi:MAG: PEGA domain-containing protein, partial [bacterium]
YAIKLTLSGYQDWHRMVTVIAGSTTCVHATLTEVSTSTTIITVNPSVTYVNGTNTFMVNIEVANVLDLHGVNFDLVYDASILCPVNQAGEWAVKGDFLPSNATMFMPPTMSTSTTIGTINVSASIFGTSSGVDGTGTIATIQFKYSGIGSPETILTLNNVALKNHLLSDIPFITSNGEVVQASTEPFGSLSITSVPSGANIFLDGTNTTKMTPATITDILSGTHTLNLTKDGYLDWSSTITVTSGETRYINGTLTMLGDFNKDFYIDYNDLFVFTAVWHLHNSDSGWRKEADFNCDGYIDYNDMFAFTTIWHTHGKTMAPALSAPHITSTVRGYIGVDIDSNTEPIETTRTLSKGDTFTINVIAGKAIDLHGVNFDLVYDGILCPVKQDGRWAKEGDFLLSNTAQQSTIFLPTISTSTTIGTINVTTSIMGTDYGVDCTGTIATIRFEVTGEGKGRVSFHNVVYANHLSNRTNISDTRGGTITTVLLLDSSISEQVLVYPNPYYADKHNTIFFNHLSKNFTIQIFTITGELVREIYEKEWDVRNSTGEKVASGIYIYLIKDSSGDKKAGKLAVIR